MMLFRSFLVLLVIFLCGNANALESCKGKRIFACHSLPKQISTKKNCHLYYQCRVSISGTSCFQCQSSIHKLTRGLCEIDYKKQCLKKEV